MHQYNQHRLRLPDLHTSYNKETSQGQGQNLFRVGVCMSAGNTVSQLQPVKLAHTSGDTICSVITSGEALQVHLQLALRLINMKR